MVPEAAFQESAYNSPLIVSWSDAQIRVRVPTNAGTGVIIVRDNAGVTISSGTNLTVRYSAINALFTSGGIPVAKEIRLINANGLGGHSFLFQQYIERRRNLDVSPAKATLQRALTTWKENAGFNVTEGGSNSNQEVNPSDGINMVMFDNSFPGNTPLPAGVLATCIVRSFLSG